MFTEENLPLFPGLGEVLVERMAEIRASDPEHAEERIRDELRLVDEMVRRYRRPWSAERGRP